MTREDLFRHTIESTKRRAYGYLWIIYHKKPTVFDSLFHRIYMRIFPDNSISKSCLKVI